MAFHFSAQAVKAKAPILTLGLVVLGSAALAVYWVFLVPIFQSPDENSHLNYALNIYSAVRLISVREPLHQWNANLAGFHVYINYLNNTTNAQAFHFDYSLKVPPNYGSREYYRNLDRNQPPEDSGAARGKKRIGNGLLDIYPYGYYAVLALWLKLLSIFSGRITVLFFGARLFSVILLVVNLLLIHSLLREFRFSTIQALVVTAIVAFFPLTTFVSSYVQADNLTCTMVLLCCFFAMRLEREPDRITVLALLGLSLGGLAVTKYHFYLAVLPAVLGLVLTSRLTRPAKLSYVRLFVVLLGPSILLLLPQLWIMWGASAAPVVGGPSTAHKALTAAAARGPVSLARFLLNGVGLAFSNFYLNGHTPLTGSTFQSFWGMFGWTDAPLVIFTPWKTNILRDCIAAATVALFVLTVLRIVQVLYRLSCVWRAGRRRRALVIAFSNPLINSYFIFTGLMFGLFAFVRNSFAPQGRNWYPFLLAIFLVGAFYAPSAILSRRVSRAVTVLILGGLALYCVFGSWYAIPSLIDRFYIPNAGKPPIVCW